MDKGDIRDLIYLKLSELPSKKGINDIVELFTKHLNYKYQNNNIPKEIFSEDIKERIKEIKIIAEHNDFKIFFIHLDLDKLTNTPQREIIKKLETYGYPFGLFIFSNEGSPRTLHFVNVKYEEKKEEREKIIRRMVVEEGGGFRTYSERLSLIEIEDENLTPLEIQAKHNEAFDVDKVTEEFFNRYKDILEKITKYLSQFNIDEEKGRYFTIQFLNRMIFIYFIQKKGWLLWKEKESDKRYLYNLYKKYKKEYKTENSNFYRDFLEPLFFYAFNQNSSFKNLPLPQEIKNSYSYMPYLNGGLFTKNKFDELGDVLLEDSLFDEIFENLLEKFNFTITEDLPFDIEVAVDPEMLGKVYESLVHGEEIQERRKAGIFFTPRVEIDYMIKMSLVENMHKNCEIEKEKLIKFVYSNDEKIDLSEEEKFNIREHLKNIKIVDPAVGSGSFLVRAMNILVDLLTKVGYEVDRFNLRKNIIKNSLYGVDVMEWAVRVAELRLWLNLLIDVEKENIDIYTKPLLPNLSFKIRQGDSLVQEIFEKYVSLRDPENLTSSIKRIIEDLAKEHSRFFEGEGERENIIKKLENDLIKKIFDEKLNFFKNEKEKKQNELKNLVDEYSNKVRMFGEDKKEKEEFEKTFDNLNREKEKIDSEIEEYNNIYDDLIKTKEKTYFLWDICFSNVFKEKGGFDLVIGNPPYVRQELIGPPLVKNASREQKDSYKKKLQEWVEKIWGCKVGGRCDLYVYFYFQSLYLLNKNGTFCFINSNSWLDVDFGKYLQEFLLKNFEIKRIIDNQVKRSFKEADINTIMVLINCPEKEFINNKVKFIMFKKPFDEAIKINNELLIEEKDELFKNEDLRIFPKLQKELLLEGIEGDEKEEVKLLNGKYEGGKWGGIYLRAPDIYFTILEKGKGKFVKLGDIAEVRFGIKTGANEFFYIEDVTDKIDFSSIKDKIINLKEIKSIDEIKKKNLRIIRNTKTGDYWLIEEEFLKPVIKSPRECKSIIIKPEDLKYKVIMCHKSKDELKNENAFILDYIEWGEKQKTKGWQGKQQADIYFKDIKSVRGRKYWYNLEKKEPAPIIMWKIVGDRFAIFYNKNFLPSDQTFYLIYPKNKKDIELLLIYMNSIIGRLIFDLSGIEQTGAYTILEITVENSRKLLTLNPEFIKQNNVNFNYENKPTFTELGFDPDKPIREQEPNPLPDRKELDDIVFDAIGLTQEERKEVYWAVAELVQNRLKKSKSI